VVHQRDGDVLLKHAEAGFDVGQALVAIDRFRGTKVPRVAEQHQLAVFTASTTRTQAPRSVRVFMP
jgi:hypothetical protein